MAANLSKKFALLCCCLMTMQALRLVISTAGFCVVRFHIDCELFNIFISRLVNAVMMSQLFGNWLGDLFVFALSGQAKLGAAGLANWAEFFCFCSALYCIVHTECGHLDGFYWSMVCAYFWWKVAEAPATSIAVESADYYFAGFTLSGVWASCLKGLVMRCVAGGENTLHFHSLPLGEVNVSVVGARSVKTTVDYRAAKWLYTVVIVITFLMCSAWTAIAIVVREWGRDDVAGKLKQTENATNAIRRVWRMAWDKTEVQKTVISFEGATVEEGGVQNGTADDQITITVRNVKKGDTTAADWGTASVAENWERADQTKILEKDVNWGDTEVQDVKTVKKKIAELAKTMLTAVNGAENIDDVTVAPGTQAGEIKLTLTAKTLGVSDGGWKNYTLAGFAGIAFGGVLAVPGALLGAGLGWAIGDCCLFGDASTYEMKWFQLIFGIVGALGGMAAGVAPVVWKDGVKQAKGAEVVEWVPSFKWDWPDVWKDKTTTKQRSLNTLETEKLAKTYAALIGLAAGLVVGLLIGGLIAVFSVDKTSTELSQIKPGPMWAGSLVGSFAGLWTGEIYNGCKTWVGTELPFCPVKTPNDERKVLVFCGMLIVVLGCSTVYSVYPGMAPCSITRFKYFNIIDILILILSAIAPIVIMGLDLGEVSWRLLGTMRRKAEFGDTTNEQAMWVWVTIGLLLLISTNVCEILVLDIMQHPFSKLAQKVTTSGWRAVLLTVTMVTSQLVSTGIGFGCVAAGSAFNDGVNNANSTAVLWTMECCGVLGEGYLTELKKYEPGKWPTQGMGKWATYKWWNRKAFGNAWAIWCCIGTTDLRRDIMLCRQ